jgi:hypothetical protein
MWRCGRAAGISHVRRKPRRRPGTVAPPFFTRRRLWPERRWAKMLVRGADALAGFLEGFGIVEFGRNGAFISGARK